MADIERILLSPVNQVDGVLYGYNFYEASLGFGSVQEINPRGGGCIGAEIILTDQGEQKLIQPSVPLFALNPLKAQEVIARAVNEGLAEGSVSLR
jgi:hypothetical protein